MASLKELLCYVALAMANGGRGLDHHGNVVLVGACLSRGTLRAFSFLGLYVNVTLVRRNNRAP